MTRPSPRSRATRFRGASQDSFEANREAIRAPVPEAEPLPHPGRAVVVCERWLGSNAFAMMKALRRQGWSVVDFCDKEYVPLRWQSTLMKVAARMLRHAGAREFNRAIVAVAQQRRPAFFLAFKGTYVFPATLLELKRCGVRCYCLYPDVSFRAHGRYIPRALACYDWVFTTKNFGMDDMRRQLGVLNASVVLHASDPDVHRPVALSVRDVADFACAVSFIGTWSPKKERLLTGVKEKLPQLDLRVWGEQWGSVEKASVLRPCVAGRGVYGEDYARAISGSRINLAILSETGLGASSGDQITSRTFHIPACKGFMLHERTDEVLSVLGEGTQTACFSDVGELARKIAHYLAHEGERIKIAEAGHREVSGHHTWDHRICTILAKHKALQQSPS